MRDHQRLHHPDAGNYAWRTILHEIGHALGLKHGHEKARRPAAGHVDSMEYSVMTYRSYVGGAVTGYNQRAWGTPQTYMMFDIAALQHMYGADYTTNAPTPSMPGARPPARLDQRRRQGVPTANKIFVTIWDGGGTDTYDRRPITQHL